MTMNRLTVKRTGVIILRKKIILEIIIAGMVLGTVSCGKSEMQDVSSASMEEEAGGVSEEAPEVTPDLPEDYMTEEDAEDDSWRQEPEVDISGYYQMYYAGTDEYTGSYVEIDKDHNYTEIQKYEYGFQQGENGKIMLSFTLQGADEEATEQTLAYMTPTDDGCVIDYNIYDSVEEDDELKRTLVLQDGENALADGALFEGVYTVKEFGDSMIYEFRADGTLICKRVESYEARSNVFMMGEVKMLFEKTDEKLTILTMDQEPMFDLIPCEQQEI